MKKNLATILIILFSLQIFSQKSVVEEKNQNIAGGKNNTLSINIKESKKKDVEKKWISLMKKYDAKITNKKEIFADDANLPLISSNTVDVYAIVEKKNNDVILIVAFDLGGVFLNSKTHTPQFKAAEKMISEFAIDISKNNLNVLISSESKNLSNLEKDKGNLGKKIKKMEKEIENYKNSISKNEKDIEKTKDGISSLEKNISDKKSEIKNLEKKLKDIK